MHGSRRPDNLPIGVRSQPMSGQVHQVSGLSFRLEAVLHGRRIWVGSLGLVRGTASKVVSKTVVGAAQSERSVIGDGSKGKPVGGNYDYSRILSRGFPRGLAKRIHLREHRARNASGGEDRASTKDHRGIMHSGKHVVSGVWLRG